MFAKIELSEVEIDSLMFFNVPLFIFLNEIQGKTFVKKNTSCFIWMLNNPYVSFGNRSHLYIIDYFSIICICDLSNHKFWFDLLACGHLVSSNTTIKKYHAIFLNCKAYNGNKRGQCPVKQYVNYEGRITLKICEACK